MDRNGFERHIRVWRAFWATLIALAFGLAFFWVEGYFQQNPLYFSWPDYFPLPLLISVGLLFLVLWIFDFEDQLHKQKFRSQPSWIFYVYFGFVSSGLVAFLFRLLRFGPWQIIQGWDLGIGLLLLAFGILFYRWISPISIDDLIQTRRFAAGAVGRGNDSFDFPRSADHVYRGMLDLNENVSVVAIYGNLGSGKSSFARMIVENFDADKTLYSYISLTETNEARDFSKLFAERWFDALGSRYPMIDVPSYLPAMKSILRENGHGLISDILNLVSNFNKGLIKTRAIIFDKFYQPNSEFVSDSVAKLFGHIPELKEDRWIIAIDEIERSPLDEIYRVIEVIERFKNEGRSGLPLKIIFLLCVAQTEFDAYLNKCAPNNPQAHLVRDFFFGQKSIQVSFPLPPIDSIVYKDYLISEIKKLRVSLGMDRDPNLDNAYPNTVVNPSDRFIAKDLDALNYILALLLYEPPRFLARFLVELRFFYNSFLDRQGKSQFNAIRFSDILALKYIELKHYLVIEFFKKTIHLLMRQEEPNNLESWAVRRSFEEEKKDIVAWIEEVTGNKLDEGEKAIVPKLVGLVAYFYFDFMKPDYNINRKDEYFRTTSYPEFLYDYLTLVSDGAETSYRKYNLIYVAHEKSNGVLGNLDESDLIGYARFLYNLNYSDVRLHLDLMNELTKRILNGKIKIQPMDAGDTMFDAAIYQFIFQVKSVIEKSPDEENASELKNALESLQAVLGSPHINTGGKYIILNSLANDERGGNSEVHSQLSRAFEKLKRYYDKELLALIRGVFAEAEQRYLDGHEIIYKNEENFFYTMYQGWSGWSDNYEEREKIRATASRDLEKYKQAIILYWSRFPYQKSWRNFLDVRREDVFFPNRDTSGELYMPLETLIEKTREAGIDDPEIMDKMKFWSGIVSNEDYKRVMVPVNDPATLRAIMTRRGFLPQSEFYLEITTTDPKLEAYLMGEEGREEMPGDKLRQLPGGASLVFENRTPINKGRVSAAILQFSLKNIDSINADAIGRWLYGKWEINSEVIQALKINTEDASMDKTKIAQLLKKKIVENVAVFES